MFSSWKNTAGNRALRALLLGMLLAVSGEGAASPAETGAGAPRRAIFVGNNWEGSIDVIDAENFRLLGSINGIPDKARRLFEIYLNPMRLAYFLAIRNLVGEGHDQYVDDMYSSRDGKLLIVSRPSFADVVAIDIATGKIVWRFPVEGYRSDHMALSPDGTRVAVSASTGKVVHVLDVHTGEEIGRFPTGDSPHENVYSRKGDLIYHSSIGHVFTMLDREGFDDLKGERVFQVVDAHSLEVLKRIDIAAELAQAGYPDLSPAIRPMAHTANERYFYFQLSFFHGFVEYDMVEERITRVVELPNLIPEVPVEEYVNDSAHHGIALSGDNETLCVAGTMSDYVALVNRSNLEYMLHTGVGEKPYWVTTSRDGEYCYVSWSGTDQMSVFDYATGQEVARIPVGDHPQRIREGVVPASWAGD